MAKQRQISGKPEVFRRAVARGTLRLRSETVRQIRGGLVEKGDPLSAGELAGLLAMKRTSDLIPHTHPLYLTGSRVDLTVRPGSVAVEAEAETVGRTGVEMEALVGASIALLTVWDMVKYLEKDGRGMYPRARVDGIRVVRKIKRPLRATA